MPSLYRHLPEEQVETVEREEVQTDENRSDDEEESMNSDTSSEASSMLNDPTIQPWVPVVSSSDESDELWTPPSTRRDDDDDDFEEVITTERRYLRPQLARRSRARRPGAMYARRGRYRQPVAEQELYELTPFERGITFNGYAWNLQPEAIISHVLIGIPEEIFYLVKWRGMQEPRLIEASVLRAYNIDMVVDYFESNVKRNS
ncbi:uncharacterized protein LOC107884148 [Acyrthosiphon pisum]|uniref:Chromo shadow domain-containing protein n=1 Tax=Acyrthosiphon pisum TaxID=7029 RepID=A0A8R2D4M3_ACYPI|nr:uncharacterized protein LOC107884148 [Acyrthosiphon pisum]|eukprot:XP_016661180.1 PREDICTED: uncharacterized protein LOC107884148 [Acyrthosiphon pisum]